jgi:hypothetical protein
MWRVTTTRTRSALTIILVVIVVMGALVSWLEIAEAWRLAGDPMMSPEPSVDTSRLLSMAGLTSYGLFNAGAGISPITMAAAVGVLVISADSDSVDTHHGRLLAVDLPMAVALLASALAALASLTRVLLVAYAWTSTPEELIGTSIFASNGISDAIALVAPSAEVLGWSAVLLLGVVRWRRLDRALVEDDLEETDPGPHDAAAEHASVHDPDADRLPGLTPQERVDPARLRPDGSSDSGFDEFHFRR